MAAALPRALSISRRTIRSKACNPASVIQSEACMSFTKNRDTSPPSSVERSTLFSTKVLASEEAVEVLATTRWQSREAFGHWIKSQEFEKAHGRGGGELLRGRPEMELYEVAVEREPEQHHDHAQ